MEVTRRHATSSLLMTWLNSNLGCFANICRTTLRVGTTFMLVVANTPSPDSNLQSGLVHTGRLFA
ncbi:Uncharacterised protein [Mycobacterium tuberculosis]|uniref:Uncharacterized protein n=1 Tax=Mycobacterium tuberculosis TaxID=1773 RepID=A0A0U0RZC4_MYCTX|nr:hypothetical protein PICSAR2_04573 [Mycobacterium avium subsp. paratuberculosis]CFS32413.1 Uncharacterised protein [Mycobacterium tuberculosis]CKR58014.1 Uncharacterised protein [Mycobacterium tuberculosis]COW37970.1 Uncharacterised protein [Mycobacterium tuberculosis]COX13171.1 Uncharacterised protein [Mycobacterium tuberculosis]